MDQQSCTKRAALHSTRLRNICGFINKPISHIKPNNIGTSKLGHKNSTKQVRQNSQFSSTSTVLLMALRYLLGRVTHTTAHHTHLTLKPNICFLAPINHNALIPTCSSSSSSSTFVLLHGSSSAANSNSGSRSSTTPPPPPCGGTCIYKGAYNDDWIISLAQFAVEQHNHKESRHLRYVRVVGASHTMVSSILYHITLEAVDENKQKVYHAIVWMQILKNFMELLVWWPVNDHLSVLGVKCGDLKLHEAVMFYMKQAKRDHFQI